MLLVNDGIGAILGLVEGDELGSIAIFLKEVTATLAIAVAREVLGSRVKISQIEVRDFKPAVTRVRVKREGVVHVQYSSEELKEVEKKVKQNARELVCAPHRVKLSIQPSLPSPSASCPRSRSDRPRT